MLPNVHARARVPALRLVTLIAVLAGGSVLIVAQAPLTIPASVHAYAGAAANGPAHLVSNAIPFKPGVVSSPRDVRVLDSGVEVPVAAQTLATWPSDGSIRALLLQFEAPFPKTYTISVGVPRTTPDRPFVRVTWDLPARVFTLPAAYLSESRIFGAQTPLGETGFPAWDRKQVSTYSRIESVGRSACASGDQFYDSITTTYQLYARTGDLRYLVNARRWALHHRRDQIHVSGPLAGHGRCPDPDKTRYTFPQGLVQDYFMFGDEEARAASALIVDNFYMHHGDRNYYIAPHARGFFTEREPAFALIGILAHYEATGDLKYLTVVRDRIATLHRMQVDNGRRAWVHNLYDHDSSEGCSPSDYGSSPWMTGLLLEALVTYHALTADPIAEESILMAVDDVGARYLARGEHAGASFVYLGCPRYIDGTPDLDNLLSHAFGYAYRLSGDITYRTIGTRIFNTSVGAGATPTHKHYDQQFRSSGHFPAYIAESPRRPTAPASFRLLRDGVGRTTPPPSNFRP